MRKRVHDPQMLEGLRTQVLEQYNRDWRRGRSAGFPNRTIQGVFGVSERDIGLEIIASEHSGTDFKLFVSVQLDDQEAILDFADLIPLSESGGVKGRAFWGSRQRRTELYSGLTKAKSREARVDLFFEAARTGKIRSGDFKVSLILDYEAAAGAGRGTQKGNVLRTDGIYQSDQMDNYWWYLRFYEDGTVIWSNSTGTPEQVKQWFSTEHSNVFRGHYETSGARLVFSVTSPEGQVDLEGAIEETVLTFRQYSHINDTARNIKYRFVAFEPEQLGESRPSRANESSNAGESATTAFETFETKSHSEAVDVLFTQALPCLPVVTIEDIRRICAETLKYQLEHGQRHVMGSADDLRPMITRNLEGAQGQLYSGQQIIGFQVSIQSELQFAALSIVVGDAQGTPGYMFGARFWRTTDQVFLLGWEGFRLSF